MCRRAQGEQLVELLGIEAPAGEPALGAGRAPRRDSALVQAQRARALPVAARPGAILRAVAGARAMSRKGLVEMLLALGNFSPIRDLLIRVMKAQTSDGDWPQWFMFFERERDIRAGDSHGDIVFWPLLALAQYLIASGDSSILDEPVPFFSSGHTKPPVSLWKHVERALKVIERRIVEGTALAAYGHGDWNDALQPADPAMRERM